MYRNMEDCSGFCVRFFTLKESTYLRWDPRWSSDLSVNVASRCAAANTDWGCPGFGGGFKRRLNVVQGALQSQYRMRCPGAHPPRVSRAASCVAGLDAGWIAAKPFRYLRVRCSSQERVLFRCKVSPAGLGHADIKPEATVFHGTECAP
jgi:hypothetical protein